MTTSFKAQLGLVATAFTLPVVLFRSKALFTSPTSELTGLAVRIVRSTAVLTALPFVLTEFPAVYSRMRSWLKETSAQARPAPRAPVVYTVTVSALSTAVFLAEPVGRLRMIMVYTWWRILEIAASHWAGLQVRRLPATIRV